MARRKEDLLDRFINSLSLRGTLLHPGTLFVVVTALTIGGALSLWERYQHRLVPVQEYQLTPQRLRITPAPAWAKVDLKRLLLETPPGQPTPTILDTNVVAKTAATLKSVGWVEDVRRVQKSSDGLDIDLSYRIPVAMVELNQTNVPGWGEAKTPQVLPIDRNGLVMPPQLLQHLTLPRISIFQPQRHQSLTPWTTWPDRRVIDAAGIMALIAPQAQQLGIYRIMTRRSAQQMATAQIPFELWPATGTQIVWGNAPGKEIAGEASAQVKLSALMKFIREHGPLDQMPRRRVDLRSGKIVITQDAHVAENDDRIFNDLK